MLEKTSQSTFSNLDPLSVIAHERLAATTRALFEGELPALEEILKAAIELSVVPDETRFPKLHIRTTYRQSHPLYLNLQLPLAKLTSIALAVSHPECAVLCAWDKTWTIEGVTRASIPTDGVGIEVIAPMRLSLSLPEQLIPSIAVVRGEIIRYNNSWQERVAAVGSLDSGSGPSFPLNFILSRSIYKVSIGGNGGTFVVLPKEDLSARSDIAVKFSADFGPWFNRRSPFPGQPDRDMIEECSDNLAALAGVDGAVVLTRDLSLVGFGATLNAVAQAPINNPSLEGGHRHKSAATFCDVHKGALAFVVSQDGPISVYGEEALRP